MSRYDPNTPSKLSPSRVTALLRELCVDLGFCIPANDQRRLTNDPPLSVDDFAEAVFTAEGMKPDEHRRLFNSVCARIARYFALNARPINLGD